MTQFAFEFARLRPVQRRSAAKRRARGRHDCLDRLPGRDARLGNLVGRLAHAPAPTRQDQGARAAAWIRDRELDGAKWRYWCGSISHARLFTENPSKRTEKTTFFAARRLAALKMGRHHVSRSLPRVGIAEHLQPALQGAAGLQILLECGKVILEPI